MNTPTTEMSEQMFQVLLEQTQAGIYVVQHGFFKYVNPHFASMFGFDDPDEIVNKVPMQALIADQDVALVNANVQLRLESNTQDLRYRFMAKRRDGSFFHVEVHGRSSHYNNEPAVIGVLIDVTEQVEAEQAIRERDCKIQALFSGNVIGILCWDAAGYIHDANPVFRQMLGLTEADFSGRGLFWKHITPAEYQPICEEHMRGILEGIEGVPIQKEYVGNDGRRIPALVNGVRLEGADAGGISFVLDLSNVRHLESERDLLAAMVERAPAVMFVQDSEGRFVYLNSAFKEKARRFGGLEGKTEFDFMEEPSARKVTADRERILKSGALEQFEEAIRYKGREGLFHFRTTKWPLRDVRGNSTGLAGVVVDITQERKTQAALARSENMVNAVFENMPGIAILKDVEGRILSFNSLFTKVHGITIEQAVGKRVWEVLPQISKEDVLKSDQHVLSTRTPYFYEGEIQIGDTLMPFLLNMFPIFDEAGDISALCGLVQNQEPLRQAQREREARERAEFEALHDSLTGLPNRKLLLDRVEQLLAQAKRESLQFVVCFIDLDCFKEVNDTLGHATGDALLQMLSSRMAACIRESDTLARVGGDEFVAVLRGDASSPEIMKVIERLNISVSQPVVLNQTEIVISCSIGYAAYPADANSIESLLSHADALMYRKKAADRHVLFRPISTTDERCAETPI